MKKNRLSFSLLAAGLAVGLAASTLHAQIPDRIKLGAFGSKTGPNASANTHTFAGIELAVSEINAKGGIAGKPVDIVVGDDQSDPTATVNEARRLAEREKVNIVVGPFTSQATLASLPIFNAAKIASVSTSGSTELTPQKGPYHFSIIPPADTLAFAMVDYAVDHLKAKSIAYIGDAGAQAKVGMEAVQVHAKKRGVQLTGTQEFGLRAQDVTAQLLSLRRGNPDVLLMWPGIGEDHGTILKGLQEVGWKIKVVNGGATGLQVAAAVKVFPESYRDVPSPMLKEWGYCQGAPMGSGELLRFRARLTAFTKNDKLAFPYAAWAYDGVYLLKAAIEGSKSIDGAAVAKWIEANAKTVKGVSGPMAASASNHFLMSSPDSISMLIDTDRPRQDGLYRRITGC